MNLTSRHLAWVAAIVVCVTLSTATGAFASYTNGGFGFPLDDPWIHLQFARNLVDYGSFSYYKDEIPTAGSTAPLYTFLAAAGFLVTNNEMILSYVLGVLFYAVSLIYFFRLAERHLGGGRGMAFLGTLLLALEPRLQWIALSGMETTLFIALLLAVVYYARERQMIALGISAGLLVWTRPEAVILFGAIAADQVLSRFLPSEEQQAGETRPGGRFTVSVLIAAVFFAGYAAFNLALSGSVLPNTYAAKLAYYSGTGSNFPALVFQYLTSGHFLIVAPLAGAGIVRIAVLLAQRRRPEGLVPLLFSAGLFLAYWIKLPYLYQNGRYLMPVLPFVLLLSFSGLTWLMSFFAGRRPEWERPLRTAQYALFGLIILHFTIRAWNGRVDYQKSCQYVSDRQVGTALWIRDHLPPDAVVATHDVGALAFYSDRKIVDMVGLVSPEMIARIGDLDAMKEFLVSQGVTHLALLRNWFEVVNVNPIYQTDEARPEIMEVFAFDPARVHFTTARVAWLTATGWLHLSRGNLREGGPLVEQAVRLDSLSSRARHHLGWAFMMNGNLDGAEQEFAAALSLHPECWPAYFGQAQVLLRRNDPQGAIRRLRDLIRVNPSVPEAYQFIARIHGQMGETEKAEEVLRELRERTVNAND